MMLAHVHLPPPASTRLPVLGRAQVSGDRVVLDGLVQHQSQQAGSVGHGGPQIPLLLEQLVQLVPLTETESQLEKRLSVSEAAANKV